MKQFLFSPCYYTDRTRISGVFPLVQTWTRARLSGSQWNVIGSSEGQNHANHSQRAPAIRARVWDARRSTLSTDAGLDKGACCDIVLLSCLYL